MSRVQVVRDLYRAYESGDRALVGIDRARSFERCWPNARAIAAFEYHRLIEAGDEVVVNEPTRTDGRPFCKPQAEGVPC
jgi:hypothetical protein